MRILLIHTQYLPAINPNVFRWSAIAMYWVQQGHDVHVMCTRRSGTKHDMVLNGVHVHRVGHASLLDMIYNIINARKRRGEVGGETLAKKGKWRQILEKMMDISWRNIYWPDGSCVWYIAGKKKAFSLHKQYHYDAIISITQPFTPHLIAAALKKRFPAIRWVMDIEDPFSFVNEIFINNRKLYKQYNYQKEGQLFTLADKVSVTVEAARQRYLQYFPQLSNKIVVTPPLYTTPEVVNEFIKEPGYIHLGYFGAFYNPIRTPDALLALLHQISQNSSDIPLILHFFGEIPPVFQPIFQHYQTILPNLRLHGLVTRAHAAAAMEAMDFLVNVGNTTDYHLPSKCVDYIMSAKPIIHLSYCKNDPFTDFLADYPLILTLDITSAVNNYMIQEMITFIKVYHGKRVEQAYVEKLIQPYTLEVIAGQYFNLLQTSVE
ncbi:MAG: hypothetical protein ACK4TA_07420 [Saprospiraceae bacterium]